MQLEFITVARKRKVSGSQWSEDVSSLSTGGQADPPGYLRVVGILEHGVYFRPANLEEANKLRAWLDKHFPVEDDTEDKALKEAYRQAASARYERDGYLEIDHDAKVSLGDDPGAYVQAWVWIYNDYLPEDVRNKFGLNHDQEDWLYSED